MKRFLLILVILAVAPLASGTTLYVDGIGGSTGYFATIQEAHDAANANDTIEIFAGTYEMCGLNLDYLHGITYRARKVGGLYENVTIYKPGSNSNYMRGSDGCTFEGLIIAPEKTIYRPDTDDNYGFYLRDPRPDNTTFKYCIFTGADSYGLYSYTGGWNLTIDHCSFIGNRRAVRLYATWTLTNGAITNCLFYDNHVWVPTSWDGSAWVPGYWTGYAVYSTKGGVAGVAPCDVQYSVFSQSFGSAGPRTDGSSSMEKEATLGTGSISDTHTPSFLSVNFGSQWFGYLSSGCYSEILTGASDGTFMGARPSAIPEPATISLLMLGLLGLRRRKR